VSSEVGVRHFENSGSEEITASGIMIARCPIGDEETVTWRSHFSRVLGFGT
jgi:hypothetical protein